MPIRKTLVRATCGVRLERIETLSAQGKVQAQHYMLRTMRLLQPRILVDRNLAEEAFDLEVIASLADPVVARLVEST